MGSVAFGLGQLGNSLAQAKEMQRQEAFEKVKQALEQQRVNTEQGQLDVSKKYADINAQRFGLEQKEFDERRRLAQLPKFVGFRTVGGKLYYGVQSADGQIKTQEVTGVDSAQDAQALEESINALPPEAQASARATIVPYLATQDYAGARGALKPISQKYAESQLPGQVTVSNTTQNTVLDTPQGPKIVQTPKTTTTQKLPAGFTHPATKSVSKTVDAASKPSAQDLGLPPGAKVLGAKPASRAEISKLIGPLGDADRRYKIMLDAVKNPNPQNDVALLFNHIGMTLSAQRGARITQAEIQRAIDARSLPEDLQAMWEKVQSGQFLTPEQRLNMLQLGERNREAIWQQGWEQAKAESLANKLPRTIPGLPPVTGVHYVNEDVQLKSGGKARVTAINPDGSYEVKPY